MGAEACREKNRQGRPAVLLVGEVPTLSSFEQKKQGY
jgi:hypothetical protein